MNSKQTTTQTSSNRAVAAAAMNIGAQDAAAIDPLYLIGNRLKLLIKDLALQPKKLQPTIIESQKSMLDLLADTKQRHKSSLCFRKPVWDTQTDDVLTDKSGAPISLYPTPAGFNAR